MKQPAVVLEFSQANYEQTLEWLGEGIMICQPGNRLDGKDDYCVLPLPRYRKRTSDGRHA
jgi:hypothetical protein